MFLSATPPCRSSSWTRRSNEDLPHRRTPEKTLIISVPWQKGRMRERYFSRGYSFFSIGIPDYITKRTKSMKTSKKSVSACIFALHLARFEPSSPSSTSTHRMSLKAAEACTSACAGPSQQRRHAPAWTLPEEKRFIQQKNFLPHRKCNNRFPAAIFDKNFLQKLHLVSLICPARWTFRW